MYLLVDLKHIRSDPFNIIRYLLFQVRQDKNEFVKKKIFYMEAEDKYEATIHGGTLKHSI